MNHLVLFIIVYVTGVIFDLAVIAYLNERKGNMYTPTFALASWALLLAALFIAIDALLEGIYDFFCSLMRRA